MNLLDAFREIRALSETNGPNLVMFFILDRSLGPPWRTGFLDRLLQTYWSN